MRWWLPLLFVPLLAFAGGAGADPEEPAEVGSAYEEPAGPPACFLAADREPWLSSSQALALCEGASSAAPVDCFLRARDELLLSDQQALDLCRCARSTWPVDCFHTVERETFLTRQQIPALCAPIAAQGLLANCRPVGGD